MSKKKGQSPLMESVLISVIIPVYNGEHYIAEAIDSVLAQECKNIEIIVVNDGSTDKTAEVVRSCTDVTLFSQSRKGVSAARNSGIINSSGDFIAFLDADDLWTKNKLRIQQALLLNDPSLDMVFGHVEQFFSPGLAEGVKSKINMMTGAMPGYIPGTMLIRRSSFLKAGFFDEGLKLGEFIDWYMRAVDTGLKGLLSPEVILRRRIHDTNTGLRDRDFRRDYLRALKASLDRRKKTAHKVEATV